MEDAREARRRRLLERKTDRLAFITGHNRTLAQSAPQDGRHPVAASGEDIITRETVEHYHSECTTVSNTLDNSCRQEPALKPDTSRLHMLEMLNENPQVKANFVSREQENEIASNEHHRTRSIENISGQLFTTSMLRKPEGHGGPRATNEDQYVIFPNFTPRNINLSVIATENIRLLFTFVVAILEVSSCNGFVIGGRLLNSIISFRPLFLVLLTDLTIIFGWAFLNEGICQKPENDVRKAMQEDKGWPNDLSKILEVAQLLHKVLGAAFMDCSICAIFLICEVTFVVTFLLVLLCELNILHHLLTSFLYRFDGIE